MDEQIFDRPSIFGMEMLLDRVFAFFRKNQCEIALSNNNECVANITHPYRRSHKNDTEWFINNLFFYMGRKCEDRAQLQPERIQSSHYSSLLIFFYAEMILYVQVSL